MEPIMKIDIHAHVRPEEQVPTTNMPLAEPLLKMYRELNIEMGVILPFISLRNYPGVLTGENAKIIAEENPGHFLWFTTVDLANPTLEEKRLYVYLEQQKALGARGVGEITSKVYFDDDRVEMLFRCCEKLGLPVLFHLAADFNSKYGVVDDPGLPRMEKMLRRHPDLIFIGHAKPFWCEISQFRVEDREKDIKEPVVEGRLAELMRECQNLHCDLSAGSGSNAMMRDSEYAAKFLEEFQDRILYGCDITSVNSQYPYDFADFLEELYRNQRISRTVYEKICRNNAVRLLKL